MNLEEAVAKVREVSDDMLLVAKPPLTWGSEAKYIALTDDFCVPSQIANEGFEVVLDHEDLITQLSYLAEKKVSGKTAAEFVAHYAVHDDWPAWFRDLKEA
ncbi:hypothetical protein ACHAC9_15305 [Massilia sp. CMS3.1]|uniref:hypothetical protein n=1 Tax=Massilia sp. CMS3.1 TaxID=3373083 RepID=UPI003EE50FB9